MTGMPNGAPGYAPERRKLGAGWIAFIIIDIVLVLGVIIFGVIVLTGSESKDNGPAVNAAPEPTPTEETSTDAAAAEPGESEEEEAPEEEEDPIQIAAPSQNIECEISEDAARCTIAELNKKPKKVDSCDGTVGYVYVLTADGVDKPCTSKGDQPGPASDDVQVLEYGSSISEYGFTCFSESDGVGCEHDGTGVGFTLAKAGAETY